MGFLQQNAYHKDDTYVPLEKQFKMMKLIVKFYERAKDMIAKGVDVNKVLNSGWVEKLIKIKYDIPNDKLEMFDSYEKDMILDFEKMEVA